MHVHTVRSLLIPDYLGLEVAAVPKPKAERSAPMPLATGVEGSAAGLDAFVDSHAEVAGTAAMRSLSAASSSTGVRSILLEPAE